MNTRADGFTLIELMVTVSLLGMLIMLATPFTTAWTSNARLNVAEGTWREAYGRAKAAALRNRYGQRGEQAPSFLCLNGTTLSVRVAASADSPASCSSTTLWSTTLPSALSSQHDDAVVSCFAFDNRGSLLSGSTCASTSDLRLQYGNSSLSLSLY
ncbi:MAG: hypothetical protein GAK45_01803 [Pseudomonas citronellolis]|nr:MAG: hypothetical protein GAK45_01803 [Pseudomonas citronellolis]